MLNGEYNSFVIPLTLKLKVYTSITSWLLFVLSNPLLRSTDAQTIVTIQILMGHATETSETGWEMLQRALSGTWSQSFPDQNLSDHRIWMKNYDQSWSDLTADTGPHNYWGCTCGVGSRSFLVLWVVKVGPPWIDLAGGPFPLGSAITTRRFTLRSQSLCGLCGSDNMPMHRTLQCSEMI